jgi:hypothetical protein
MLVIAETIAAGMIIASMRNDHLVWRAALGAAEPGVGVWY